MNVLVILIKPTMQHFNFYTEFPMENVLVILMKFTVQQFNFPTELTVENVFVIVELYSATLSVSTSY